MTFGWRSVAAIEGDITYRFSIAGVSARHSQGVTGRVRQLFNASWRETREIVAMAMDGEGAYLTRGSTLPLITTPAVAGETYAEIPWPVDAVAVGGVRVQVDSSRWYWLGRRGFTAIQDYQPNSQIVGYAPARGPRIFCSRLLPDGVGSVETPGQIMIAPVPASGSYALWYLQGWQDRTGDADTIPGMANWIEHAILDTLIKMTGPDGDSQKQAQLWMIAKNAIEDKITARAQKIIDGLPLEPRDARGDGMDDDPYRSTL